MNMFVLTILSGVFFSGLSLHFWIVIAMTH
jgi:hypothetical protein